MSVTMHTFMVKVAEELNVNCAIILNNLHYWQTKNEANNKHYYEGRYWTYNSTSAFQELFPYMTIYQIRSSLQRLEDEGYIKSGNFNINTYDRTKWYTVLDAGKRILGVEISHCSKTTNACVENHKWNNQKPQMEDSKTTNGKVENRKSIYNSDSKPNGKPDSKPNNIVPFKEIIDYLNEKADRQFRLVESNKKFIRARWNENYTLDDFKKVVDNKVAEWKDTDMEQYLRPSTLFGTKFDNYLNQTTKSKVKEIAPMPVYRKESIDDPEKLERLRKEAKELLKKG